MVAALPVDINLPATTLSLLSPGTADMRFQHGFCDLAGLGAC